MGREKCVAVEPASSRNLSGGALGGHRIEGIGAGFIPKIMRMDLVDGIKSVSDEEAYATAREMARTEGVFGGISSGANVFAALQLAKDLGPGHRVVTVIVDSGLRYRGRPLPALETSAKLQAITEPSMLQGSGVFLHNKLCCSSGDRILRT